MSVTPLPSAPNRNDPTSFPILADPFMSALPLFGTECNALQADVNNKQVAAASSATAAAISASNALTSENNALSSANSAAFSAAGALIAAGGTATSITSNTLAYGTMTFTVQTGKGFVVGMSVKVASTASPTNWASGDVTAYNSGTGSLTIAVTRVNGTASGSAWTVSISAPAATSDLGYIHVRDEKASGTNGGSAVVGTQTRALNTVVTNTMTGASLAANMVTLPPGTYRYEGYAPAQLNGGHQCSLANHTDSSVILSGSSSYPFGGAGTLSLVSGRFTISSTKVVRLDHWVANTSGGSTGLGVPVSSGLGEVYSDLKIWKEA